MATVRAASKPMILSIVAVTTPAWAWGHLDVQPAPAPTATSSPPTQTPPKPGQTPPAQSDATLDGLHDLETQIGKDQSYVLDLADSKWRFPAVDPATNGLPCGAGLTPTNLEPVADTCKNADVIYEPDGHAAFVDHGNKHSGRWCLQDTQAAKWDPMLTVQIRSATHADSASQCRVVLPNKTYAPPDGSSDRDPIVLLRVFPVRSSAQPAVSNARKRLNALFDEFRDQATLVANPKPGPDDFAKAEESRNRILDVVLRWILTHPKHLADVPIWPVFDAYFPGHHDKRTVVALAAGAGYVDKISVYEGHQLLLFAHDMLLPTKDKPENAKPIAAAKPTDTTADSGPTGDSLAFFKGKKLQDEVSPIALFVGAVFSMVQKAGIVPDRGCFLGAGDCLIIAAIDRFAKLPVEARVALVEAAWDEHRATMSSRVRTTDDLDGGYQYVLQICRNAAACNDKTSDEDRSALLRIDVQNHHLCVSTATEMALNYVVDNQPIGGYRFEQIGGVTGPDQFWQLRQQNAFVDHVTFSQLVVGYPFCRTENRWADGLGFAFGPSVFNGSGVDFLTQWNFRPIVWEPWFARGLLITLGFAVRTIQVPTAEFPDGVVLAVDRNMNVAPKFSSDTKAIWELSLGLAVDLSVLGKVGDLFKGGDSGGKK